MRGIVGGSPAKGARRRCSDEDVERLLAIAWRDWPPDHLAKHDRTGMSGSVDELKRPAVALA
ncbi:predicted protein [Streptomyces sp. AA4]|uniref:hypothetical protein n=1 Tax=Amycolatopsis sp. AA4 TaxID=1896961 RepID=UPI0001B55640|nr:hypothetical protein [Amycolatopsis sp. AA4]EFL10125.1 predicted protein [Streptomyces sp. AA4]